MSAFQDFEPVVIRNVNATKSSGTINQGGEKKKLGATGISGKLDNQTAHKLDDDAPRPPDSIASDVGKVNLHI